MIDASHEPLEKNIEITRRIVERAHVKGIVVEAELGQLGGVEEDVVGSVCLTEPASSRRIRREERLRFAGRGHRHFPRSVQVRRQAGAAHGPIGRDSSSPARRTSRWSCTVPASVPKEWVGSRQRRRRQAQGRQRRARRPVPARRQARRLQDQHRHRRPAGLVRASTARPSATSPRISIRARPASRSWRSTPSTSPTRTRSSARPGSSRASARRCPLAVKAKSRSPVTETSKPAQPPSVRACCIPHPLRME